jgi:hypothetical protein
MHGSNRFFLAPVRFPMRQNDESGLNKTRMTPLPPKDGPTRDQTAHPDERDAERARTRARKERGTYKNMTDASRTRRTRVERVDHLDASP